MDWQDQLITIYLYICKEYESELWVHAQRFSSHVELQLTDEEVISLYWFGVLEGHRSIKQIYTYADSHLREWFPHLMRVKDYYPNGKRWWIRLHEKGGKYHEMPAHHTLEAYLDEYLNAAGIRDDANGSLFRTFGGKGRAMTENPMVQTHAWQMIRRRANAVGIFTALCNHSFRGTGITTYLKNGGTLEKAQQMAAHESPRTTKLYDRTQDEISLDEIERVII
ncbi:MAG: tyrosine-type recombinase/integrase [bacterium]